MIPMYTVTITAITGKGTAAESRLTAAAETDMAAAIPDLAFLIHGRLD